MGKDSRIETLNNMYCIFLKIELERIYVTQNKDDMTFQPI